MQVGFQSAVIDDNQTGLGTYARNLLKSYEEMGTLDQLYLIHYPGRNAGFYTNKNTITAPRFPLGLSKVFGIPAAIKKCNPDVVHFPVHRCDDFLSYFLNAEIPKILTIHDLIPFFSDEQMSIQTRVLWVPMLKIAHKKNMCIITVSDHTRKDCEKFLNIPKEKIRVIPIAADPVFRQARDKDAVRLRVAERFGIASPYIFYTGALVARKNIRRLVEAFVALKKKNYPHKLVIGGSGRSCPPDLANAIPPEIRDREILFTGYLTRDELVDMYNAAELFVYPSLYEGFGIPPLEAMSCGTPVVVSGTSSLPEVVGDAACLIDPYDTMGLSAALEELILDEGYRAELSGKGLARSKLFSWEKTGKETWKVYEEVAEKETG